MTRRILDTFKDADGLPVTATFAAFMLEHGYRTYREAQDAGTYDDWRRDRANEFASSFNPGMIFAAAIAHPRFIDWLDARAHDHAARREVEAA
jgi:hypothetical protein